ncbi:MAG: HupE/UreJ family protein [Pseudomonadota bacterium]
MLRAPNCIRQALLILLALMGGVAHAHEIRPALAEISFPEGQNAYRIDFILNVEALMAGIGPEHDDTSESQNAADYNRLRASPPNALQAEFEGFAALFIGGITLDGAGQPLRPEVQSLFVPPVGDLDLPRDSTLTIGGPIPDGVSAISFAWDPSYGSIVFRTEVSEGGEGYSAFLQNGEASVPIPVTGGVSQSSLDVFVDYIGVGFEHIVPLGLDHILFVIGLFLFSAQLRPLLIQVTAFTVAHTVTLALGLFGVVRIAPEIVEPLIALSIVYVAVENVLFKKLTPWRPLLVFAFGLLHGLGFAGVLTEFGLPEGRYVAGLIGFNIGVELGQLFVVLICFLVVGLWFGSKDWYRLRIVYPASIAIGGYALAWFFERSLEIELALGWVVAISLAIGVVLLLIKRLHTWGGDALYVLGMSAALTIILRMLEGMIP